MDNVRNKVLISHWIEIYHSVTSLIFLSIDWCSNEHKINTLRYTKNLISSLKLTIKSLIRELDSQSNHMTSTLLLNLGLSQILGIPKIVY